VRCFGTSTPDIEHVQFQVEGEEDVAVRRVCVRAIELVTIESEKWAVGLRALGAFGPGIVNQIEELGGTPWASTGEDGPSLPGRVSIQSYVGEFATLGAAVRAYLALQAGARVALWPAVEPSSRAAKRLNWLDRESSVPADALSAMEMVLVSFFDTDCFGLQFRKTNGRPNASRIAARIAQEFCSASLSDDYLY